jgi:NTE family protein
MQYSTPCRYSWVALSGRYDRQSEIMTMATDDIRQINLALQGGGSHGAFTWGVLDRLLEDGRLKFAAVSGTSAGAMNAVALADGWARDGSEGARERLHVFWRAVAAKGRFSPVQRMPWDVFWGNWSVENTPGFVWFDLMSRAFSPYAANPFNVNPLRDVVENEIDFDNLKSPSAIKVFISATNVETGQLRVFSDGEISADAGDGLGLPAADFPCRRNRWRALLGRRLWRQSGDLAVLPR